MVAVKNKSCSGVQEFERKWGGSKRLNNTACPHGWLHRACSRDALSVVESSSGDVSRDEKYRSNSQDLRVEVVQGCTKRGRLSEREKVASVNSDAQDIH